MPNFGCPRSSKEKSSNGKTSSGHPGDNQEFPKLVGSSPMGQELKGNLPIWDSLYPKRKKKVCLSFCSRNQVLHVQ